MIDWNARFMSVAELVATWSKDRSTKVGCVIVGPKKHVVSVGYNGFARGVSDDHPERHENRDIKLKLTAHAEHNAVLNAHFVGASVLGCDLYVTALPPCTNCSSAIVQSGIARVFCYKAENPDLYARWKDEIEWGEVIRREGGVETVYLERNP